MVFDGEEVMLFHIPEDLSASRKHQCLRNMVKRKNQNASCKCKDRMQ